MGNNQNIDNKDVSAGRDVHNTTITNTDSSGSKVVLGILALVVIVAIVAIVALKQDTTTPATSNNELSHFSSLDTENKPSSDEVSNTKDGEESHTTTPINDAVDYSNNLDTLKNVKDKSIDYYNVPLGTKVIAANAFYKCTKLKKVDLPHTLSVIEPYAFAFCNNLSEIKIPEDVTKIGKMCFFVCNSLNQIVLPKKLTEIGANPFKNTNTKVVVNDNKNFDVKNNYLYDKRNHLLIYYFGSDSLIHLDKEIQIIGEYAFADNFSIKEITAESIVEIRDYAFDNCIKLCYFACPKSLTKMGLNPFRNIHNKDFRWEGCYDNFIMSDGLLIDKQRDKLIGYLGTSDSLSLYVLGLHRNRQIKTIGDCAFSNCRFVKELTIDTDIESIGINSFEGCNLTIKANKHILDIIHNGNNNLKMEEIK